MVRDPSVSTPDQRPERHHSLSIDDMSSSTAALLRDRNLSDQEAKVAFALYGDYSTARMAQALGISRSTAGTYCSRLYAKLGVANRAEARSALVRILGPTEDYLRKDEGRRRWVPRSTLTASVSLGITVSGIGVLIASLCTSPSFPSTWTISRIGPMPPPCLILLGLACIAFAHTPRRRRTSWQYEACSACSGLALLIFVQDLFSPIRRTICGRLVEGGFGFAVYTVLVAALIVYAVVHFSTISANIHLGCPHWHVLLLLPRSSSSWKSACRIGLPPFFSCRQRFSRVRPPYERGPSSSSPTIVRHAARIAYRRSKKRLSACSASFSRTSFPLAGALLSK